MAKYREVSSVSETTPILPEMVLITGPTAVGKSALALELATRFPVEIVSADSRQVYRHLDIGTAKPSVAERAAVRHHLIDLVEPDEGYSAAAFRTDADGVLIDIKRRENIAFIVGGSPHYLQAVLERLDIPPVLPQPELRRDLEQFAQDHGAQALHGRLAQRDPVAASEIAATNVRRVVRALEVIAVTGELFSVVGRRRGTPLPVLRLAVTTDRESLYRRVDERVDRQIEAGLIDEVKWVLEQGFPRSSPPLAGLVYREAIAVATGEMSLEAAARRIKETTHAFVRRQYTWFRRDPSLIWLELRAGVVETAAEAIERYLRSRSQARPLRS